MTTIMFALCVQEGILKVPPSAQSLIKPCENSQHT